MNDEFIDKTENPSQPIQTLIIYQISCHNKDIGSELARIRTNIYVDRLRR